MGHRRFAEPSRPSHSFQAKKGNTYSRAPNPSAKNYLDEMAPVNGMRELTEEQLAEAQELRNKFRDNISKKMGELLLRGFTMLDAYCQVCNGILMEDRSGVRTCVTCELFAEHTKEGSRLVAEVPLDTTAGGVVPGNSALLEEQPTTRNVVHITDIGRKQWAEGNSSSREVGALRSKESTPSVPTSLSPNFGKCEQCKESTFSFDGCTAALHAIDRKLKWASERIDRIDNPTEIREMFALVNEGLHIIRSAKSDISER